MVAASAPVLPPEALQQHIFGTVTVRVTLDEQSKLISATIVQSPSPLLNDAALDAARRSTFRTAVRNCRPVSDSYNFLVVFNAPAGGVPQSLLQYFHGAWSCGSAAGSTIEKLVGVNVSHDALFSANAFLDGNGALFASTERYTMQGDKIALSSSGALRFAGTSDGWQGNTLTFVGPTVVAGQGSAQTMTFTRRDDNHYDRSVVTGSGPASIEQCSRQPSPAYMNRAASP